MTPPPFKQAMGCYDQSCAQLGPSSAGAQMLMQLCRAIAKAAESFGTIDPHTIVDTRGSAALKARLTEAVADIRRLACEKEQLLGISNQLRGELLQIHRSKVDGGNRDFGTFGGSGDGGDGAPGGSDQLFVVDSSGGGTKAAAAAVATTLGAAQLPESLMSPAAAVLESAASAVAFASQSQPLLQKQSDAPPSTAIQQGPVLAPSPTPPPGPRRQQGGGGGGIGLALEGTGAGYATRSPPTSMTDKTTLGQAAVASKLKDGPQHSARVRNYAVRDESAPLMPVNDNGTAGAAGYSATVPAAATVSGGRGAASRGSGGTEGGSEGPTISVSGPRATAPPRSRSLRKSATQAGWALLNGAEEVLRNSVASSVDSEALRSVFNLLNTAELEFSDIDGSAD